EGNHEALFFLVELGGNEGPQLIKNDRSGKQEAGDERELEIGLECVARRGEVERRLPRDTLLPPRLGERLPQPREDRVAVFPGDEHAGAVAEDAADQPRAKLLEVLPDRHFSGVELLRRHRRQFFAPLEGKGAEGSGVAVASGLGAKAGAGGSAVVPL